MTMMKKPTVNERIAEIRREIGLCAGMAENVADFDSLMNVAALLIIIARQERDEALGLADALFQLGQKRP